MSPDLTRLAVVLDVIHALEGVITISDLRAGLVDREKDVMRSTGYGLLLLDLINARVVAIGGAGHVRLTTLGRGLRDRLPDLASELEVTP